ncbi:MAG TPA: hypothetical protein PK264_12395, partial [Hyphomicrobiaceae bacterium]|nr:hypothetical protein [Hyphomicrobiaceae bacterium]
HRSELHHVDEAIEQYLVNSFGIDANYDIYDALDRLMRDGIVSEDAEGYLVALPPSGAAKQIDILWDAYLDELPDVAGAEGEEMDTMIDPRSATLEAAPQSEDQWLTTS